MHPDPNQPTTPAPFTTSNGPWFVSACNTGGVVEIMLCKDFSLDNKPIIGMLLRYMDGHRVCVGQFRFDTTLETIPVEQGTTLYIGSRTTATEFLYVAHVSTHPTSDAGLTWNGLGWGRDLEWWFSHFQTIVRPG